MKTIQELQNLRTELIQQMIQDINEKFDALIYNLQMEQHEIENNVCGQVAEVRACEVLYPLTVSAGVFKGEKPIGVCFGDGRRVAVTKWKQVATVILQECNRDIDCHNRLMQLRDTVKGRDRILLGSEIGKMRSPMKIDDNLYIETHYDAESLIRILTTRILDPINFNYNNIKIAIRN